MAVSPDPALAGDVTRLLRAMREGAADAPDRLYPLVYGELRRAAARALRRERSDHTLQPTELVHEVFLKLLGSGPEAWQDRAHFIGVAARAMRQILVDHARRRNAAKRGGGWARTTIGDELLGQDVAPAEMLALNDALDRLDALDPRLRAVVEYRFFGGLTEKEIAELLGVTERTVQRDWVKARAWLYKELYAAGDAG